MTNMTGICKACGQDLKARHLLPICDCGWHDPTPRIRHDLLKQKRTIHSLFAFVGILLLGLIHFGRWGGDGFAIAPLKVANAIGAAGIAGTNSLIEICVRRGDLGCADAAFEKLVRIDAQNAEAHRRAAHFHFQTKNIAASIKSYESYLNTGGRDYDALNEYGQALILAGQKTKATEIFRAAIDSADKTTLPLRATTQLVRLLIEQNQAVEAKRIILAFRKDDQNGERYFSDELKALEKVRIPAAQNKANGFVWFSPGS